VKLSFNSDKPLFLGVAEWVEDAILDDIFVEETQVPSITEISVQYNINPATALKGINLLVDSGLLYKKRGLGMFVAIGARSKLLESRRQQFSGDYVDPLVSEAKRLEVSHTDLQNMVERRYNEHDN